MSAALRAPARAGVAARHYLALLGRETAPGAVLLAVAVSFQASINRAMFEGVLTCLPLMALLPLVHWRAAGRDVDPALPLGGRSHRLVMVACGAAWAAAALAVPVALLMALTRQGSGAWLGGHPWWYPLPLLAAGLCFYLLGSAVWLRSAHPGRVLLVLLCLGAALKDALGLGVPAWTVAFATREELRGVGTAGWIAASLAWLGAGCAAVALAAAAGGRARPGEQRAVPAHGSLAGPGTPRRRRAPGLRPRPASALVVLRSQAALLRHRMAWPAVIALLVAWTGARAEMAAPAGEPVFLGGSTPFVQLAVIGFLWPLLVWMDERGPGREHEEALPVSALARRLARVAAGGAALAALCALVVAGPVAGAWIAGTLPSPAALPARTWVGVPAAVLMMYLAGSLPLLLSLERPVRRMAAWWAVTFLLVLPWLWSVGLRDARLSPTAALSVFTDHPAPWAGALLFWLALLAAAAAGAAAAGARDDRLEGPSPAHGGRPA
ncbi:MAG TPA: hypothetical protein VF615_21415 [Longimicrobiaceae bacterium]